VLGRSLVYARRHHVGLLALFVALGGTSYAASQAIPGPGGVIHGCYQAKKGSLRVVASGRRCARGERSISWSQTGPAGQRGAAGGPGAVGSPGATGVGGPNGADFTIATTLQPGQTESGSYAVTGNTLPLLEAVNFRVPLAGTTTNIEFRNGAISANCPGPRQAARGFLCIYKFSGSATFVDASDMFTGVSNQAGPTGFVLDFSATSATWSVGTWAITAP
jgi:hypothetical protein